MKNIVLLIFLGMIGVACSEEKEEKNTVAQTVGKPEWSAGYPQVRVGARSADLVIKTDKQAKLFYLVTDTAMTFSATDLMREATSPSLAGVKANGTITINALEEKTQTFENLEPGKQYYFHLIARNPLDETSEVPVQTLKKATFVRQDTSEFFSQAENREVSFLIYQPEEALKNPQEKFPAIIFLGGLGEIARGNKTINLLRNGSLPDYISKGNDVPMIVISPQHVTQVWNVHMVEESINYGIKNYPIDEDRIYLVGTSAGAFGSTEYALTYPTKLAALVPISGGGKNDEACKIKNVAVWAFHNQHDDIVSPGRSITFIDALSSCAPSKEVKLQLFPDPGHNCWRRIFDPKHQDWAKTPDMERIDIYQWLLQQRR